MCVRKNENNNKISVRKNLRHVKQQCPQNRFTTHYGAFRFVDICFLRYNGNKLFAKHIQIIPANNNNVESR